MIVIPRVARAAALALVALLVLAGVSSSDAPPPRVVMLRNGLRVLLAPDSLATTADVAVWYPCGTRWERPGESGAAALSERLLLRGSEHVPDGEHVRRVRDAGGVVGTNPTPDGLCVYETVPPEALELVLRLEADRMAGLRGSAAAIEQDRGRLREQHARVLTTVPAVEGLERLHALLFPGHPYGSPVLGNPANVDRLKPVDVAAWARARLGPSGAVLTVTGRFDAPATLALVRRLFEPLARRGEGAGVAARVTEPRGPVRAEIAGHWPVRALLMGWRAPGAADASATALEVLTQILGVGPGSRLRGSLPGAAAGQLVAQGNIELRRDASLVWVTVLAPADADTAALERDVLDAAARLAQEPPSPEELTRARKQLEVTSRFAQQTSRGRAQALGEALWLTGDATASASRLGAIARVSAEDVRAAAQRVLADANRATVWVAPAADASGVGR